jgi:hypothetical protein
VSRRATLATSVGLALALLGGCSETSPPPFELLRVEPSTVRSSVETKAIVHGKQFYDSLKVRLNDNDPMTIDRGWDVSVDAVRHLSRNQTSRIDSTSLSIMLPAGLSIGVHDLSVTDPRGQSRTLMNAFTVEADGNTTAPNPSGGATSISSGGTTSLSDGASGGNTLLSSGGTESAGGTNGIAGSSNTLWSIGGTQAAGGITGTAGITNATSGGTQAAGGITGTADSGNASTTSGGTGTTGGVTSASSGGTQAAGGTAGSGAVSGGTDAGGGTAGAAAGGAVSTTSGGTQAAGGTAGTGQTSAPANTCDDGIQNGDETEMDCGGSTCPGCVCMQANFSSPTRIDLSDRADIATNAQIYAPSLSADGLTMFFAVNQDTTKRIYQATRASTSTTTFANTRATFSSATDNRGTPALSHDGLTLYFFSDGLSGAGNRDIWAATRQNLATAFAAPEAISGINTIGKDQLPWVSADDLTLYYVSDSLGTLDIWRTRRASRNEAFGAGSPVAELNSSSAEARIALTSDGRVAYFTSERGQPGSYDIWVALRSTGGTFAAATPVTSLNSTFFDMDVTLTRDNTELFFVSDRGVGAAAFIYHVFRQCQ